MNHSICDFPFDNKRLDDLETALSPGRLQLYRTVVRQLLAKDDDKYSLVLYCWNNTLSQALYWPLHGFEISLRNAMADRLFDRYGDDWYDQMSGLKQGNAGEPNMEVEKVHKAKLTVLRDRETIGHDTIVASISFGFWEGLLKPEYEVSLWDEKGMFAELFPGYGRDIIFKNVNQIKRLRNNIAHHEPVFVHWPSKKFRPLYQDYKKIIKAIRWTSPETGHWVQHHSCSDFFYAWNGAPVWLCERKELIIKRSATSAAESDSDNWMW